MLKYFIFMFFSFLISKNSNECFCSEPYPGVVIIENNEHVEESIFRENQTDQGIPLQFEKKQTSRTQQETHQPVEDPRYIIYRMYCEQENISLSMEPLSVFKDRINYQLACCIDVKEQLIKTLRNEISLFKTKADMLDGAESAALRSAKLLIIYNANVQYGWDWAGPLMEKAAPVLLIVPQEKRLELIRMTNRRMILRKPRLCCFCFCFSSANKDQYVWAAILWSVITNEIIKNNITHSDIFPYTVFCLEKLAEIEKAKDESSSFWGCLPKWF